jgi:hypothetical protein
MKKIRKNFNFDSRLIEKAKSKASSNRRSLTSYIEMLIEADLKKSDKDEFFEHMAKRHADC